MTPKYIKLPLTFRTPQVVVPRRSICCSLRLYGVLIIEILRQSFVVPVSLVVSWFIVSRPASTFSWASWSASLSLWPPGVTFTSRDRSRG